MEGLNLEFLTQEEQAILEETKTSNYLELDCVVAVQLLFTIAELREQLHEERGRSSEMKRKIWK